MVEPQEIETATGLPQVHQGGLGRRQGQAHAGQDVLQGGAGLLGSLPGRAQDDQVIRIADENPQAPVLLLPGTVQAVEHHVSHQGADHAPNARGNFCFEVTLGYRRVERGR